MNRGLWVVLLNALMRTEGGDWPAMLEPASGLSVHNSGRRSASREDSAGSSSSDLEGGGADPQPPSKSDEGNDGAAEETAEPSRATAAGAGSARVPSVTHDAQPIGTEAGGLEQ